MAKTNLKPGDIVVLKSGGPKMTISRISDNYVYCDWFDSPEITCHRDVAFHAETLQKVDA